MSITYVCCPDGSQGAGNHQDTAASIPSSTITGATTCEDDVSAKLPNLSSTPTFQQPLTLPPSGAAATCGNDIDVRLANFPDAGISGQQLTLPPFGAPTPALDFSKDPLPLGQIKEPKAGKKAKFRPGPAHTAR